MVFLATQDHFRYMKDHCKHMTVSLRGLQYPTYYDNHVSHLQSLFALIQVLSSHQDGLLSLPSWVIGLERAGTCTYISTQFFIACSGFYALGMEKNSLGNI